MFPVLHAARIRDSCIFSLVLSLGFGSAGFALHHFFGPSHSPKGRLWAYSHLAAMVLGFELPGVCHSFLREGGEDEGTSPPLALEHPDDVESSVAALSPRSDSSCDSSPRLVVYSQSDVLAHRHKADRQADRLMMDIISTL